MICLKQNTLKLSASAFSTRLFIAMASVLLASCMAEPEPEPELEPSLVFNEIISNNEGVYIDENGELDDWVEIANASDGPLDLSDFSIADGGSPVIELPSILLQPQEVIVLWADDAPEEGEKHLPFKISSSGETLKLFNSENIIVDEVAVPKLDDNQAYARFPSISGNFSQCRYTSPQKSNGASCQAIAAPTVEDAIKFDNYDVSGWPSSVVPTGLAINELALNPARFIELKNFSSESVDLNNYQLMLGAMDANSPLPVWNRDSAIILPNQMLAPGEITSVGLTASDVEALALQPFFEGGVVLYRVGTNNATKVDAVPFMYWPEQAVLARKTTTPYNFNFCQGASENADNQCTVLPSRELGNRARGLYTPNDFNTLEKGMGKANIASVKFVIDINNGNTVHYLSSERWPLHYTFVREVINNLPELNRCDSVQAQEFNRGWAQFSQQNYANSVTRSYHLGTLSHHANADIRAVEFTFGDAITAPQIIDVFYTATAAMPEPTRWVYRPQNESQIARARLIEGELPIVGPNAPFQNLTLQALASGVAYGTLEFIETSELDSAFLGPKTIVITNDVPNDIDFVGGLITEAFQTPLAHVNILSQGRGTPNLALPNARLTPEIMALLNKLVRFEVSASGYSIRAAALEEAEVFWAQHNPNTEVLVPRLDDVTKHLIDLSISGIDALPTIGAKAAQLAELFNLAPLAARCAEGASFAVPEKAFAIPMRHYLDHFSASGAQAYLMAEMAQELFKTDVSYRRTVLHTAQQMILQHPVDALLLAEVEAAVAQKFGSDRVRFRSSSNTEDLSNFNGAGLYTSQSAEIGDDDRKVEDAMRAVWASLWNVRAYEERNYARVDQSQVAMGILVHQAFRNERANGVAIARNILNPTRSDQYYFNSQGGEASVTNPAPGVITEQLVYQFPPRTPRLTYHSHSSIVQGAVTTPQEIRALACAINAVQNHFEGLLNAEGDDPWFTMESEFKFLGAQRTLLIKQARPYPVGDVNIADDCRGI